MRRSTILILVTSSLISVAASANPPGLAEDAKRMDAVASDNDLRYSIDCPKDAQAAEICTVDKPTYFGWRTYHAHCFQCHGGSAMGSTFAPSLLDRFDQGVDLERFEYVVQNGFTGQTGVMPKFDKNKQVTKNLSNLYLYIRARADGALPPGRPKRESKSN